MTELQNLQIRLLRGSNNQASWWMLIKTVPENKKGNPHFRYFAISLCAWFFTATSLKDLAFIQIVIAESKLLFLRIITGYYNYAYPLNLFPEICQVRLFYIFTATYFVQNFTLFISRKYLFNFPRKRNVFD